jgi:hypothetical protein
LWQPLFINEISQGGLGSSARKTDVILIGTYGVCMAFDDNFLFGIFSQNDGSFF